MKPANSVFAGYGTTAVEEMRRLAAEHDAIDLGQADLDGTSPPAVLDAAAAALANGANQPPAHAGQARVAPGDRRTRSAVL